MKTVRKLVQINYETGNFILRYYLCCLLKLLISVITCIGIVSNGAASCDNIAACEIRKGKSVTKSIEEVLKDYTEELMSLPGVIGTAQGLYDDRPCIKVYVIKKTPELDQKIPDTFEGYKVMIEETGEINALPNNPY